VRGWTFRHPLLTALLLVVAVAVPGFVRVEHAADEARRAAIAVEAETERATAQACNSRRDIIIILRGLVAESEASGRSVDLTAVEGFDELSLDMQLYLTNLEALLNASPPPGEGYVDRALKRIPIPDC
jgi:hypothetical protein